MRQIVLPISLTKKILGQQKIDKGIPYRLSTHCMCVERPEGILFYHVLTGELLLLSPEEAALLRELPGPVSPMLEEMAAGWFLRPEGADDMALADQVREIAKRLRKKRTALTRYTIFTTMNCNARCFYCFEADWEKISMTEQTALDTAKYIIAHCGGKPVHLRWFGGEPLVNTRVIDVITDCLRQQNIKFHSTIISNGYLFDEALVQRARDIWNLKQVQVTLDGTEEVYNRRKAYVNPQGSPYRRVLRNIGLLLDAGVLVSIRLNMDQENEGDLYALVDELAERFAGKSGFGVYLMVICENEEADLPGYAEGSCSYAQKFRALLAYAERKGITAREPLSYGFAFDSCMADSDNSTTVTPEGRLGRCSSCMNGTIWGSIYLTEADEEVLRQWKERKPPEEVCRVCTIYPQCIRLKKCPAWLEYCSPIERSRREDVLRRAVLGAYEDWKAAGHI